MAAPAACTCAGLLIRVCYRRTYLRTCLSECAQLRSPCRRGHCVHCLSCGHLRSRCQSQSPAHDTCAQCENGAWGGVSKHVGRRPPRLVASLSCFHICSSPSTPCACALLRFPLLSHMCTTHGSRGSVRRAARA
jgi:hypothetical protein